MTVTGMNWDTLGTSERDSFLSWMRDAANLLLLDAVAVNSPNVDPIRNALDSTRSWDASTSGDRVRMLVDAYDRIWSEMDSRRPPTTYAAPPVDVAVPYVTRAGSTPVAGDRTVESWERLSRLAEQSLPPGDRLLGAIHRWADWASRAPRPPIDLGQTIDPNTTNTWTDRDVQRSARLNAWGYQRLATLEPAHTTVTPNAPLPPRPPSQAPGSQSSGGGTVLAFIAGAWLVSKLLKGR